MVQVKSIIIKDSKISALNSVLVNVSNQKPPLLEPKPAKTRPKNFYQKNHHNFRPNRHNFRNFEVEKLNFLQIPLMFTEKCENIAFFLPAPKNFFRHKKVPNRQKPANPPLLPTLLELWNWISNCWQSIFELDQI